VRDITDTATETSGVIPHRSSSLDHEVPFCAAWMSSASRRLRWWDALVSESVDSLIRPSDREQMPFRIASVWRPGKQGSTHSSVWMDAPCLAPSPSVLILVDASLPPARTCPDYSAPFRVDPSYLL
jgi:hypothetical protein